jgi:spermidine/putrescine transport system permease protein
MAATVQPRREKRRGFLIALPAIVWLLAFFVAPLLIVLVVSFLTRGRGGLGELPLTFANYERVFEIFLGVIGSSLWFAFLTTVVCLLVGYPLAFFISTRKSTLVRSFTLFMIILPFWTNFLVRTYAMRSILSNEGPLNSILVGLGLTQEPLALLNSPEAVILGLIYGFLPFMVLPIYASVERFDFRFVEAAHDLGANDIRAFLRVVFPMTLPGVIAGCILVFIPAIGSFVTPDLLGGPRGVMIGNLITTQFRGSGNQPLGSALSMVLMVMVMISLIIYIRFGNQESR